MKKLIFITNFVFLTYTIVAQKSERIEAYRAAFFTEQLELTTEESRAFWPVYDEFTKEKEALKNQYDRKIGKLENMSDAELEAAIMQRFDYEAQELELKRKYFQHFKAVLPIRKVARLQRTERQFKKRILEMIQERRERRKRGGGKK